MQKAGFLAIVTMRLKCFLQAEKMISDYTRGIQRMEQRMRDSESRAADASKQVQLGAGVAMAMLGRPEEEGIE